MDSDFLNHWDPPPSELFTKAIHTAGSSWIRISAGLDANSFIMLRLA